MFQEATITNVCIPSKFKTFEAKTERTKRNR